MDNPLSLKDSNQFARPEYRFNLFMIEIRLMESNIILRLSIFWMIHFPSSLLFPPPFLWLEWSMHHMLVQSSHLSHLTLLCVLGQFSLKSIFYCFDGCLFLVNFADFIRRYGTLPRWTMFIKIIKIKAVLHYLLIYNFTYFFVKDKICLN